MKKINLLGIIGSARRNGNSKIMLEEAIEGFKTVVDPNLKIIDLSTKKINYCVACYKCKEEKKCVLKDDFNEIFDDWLKADAIIFSAPVYLASIPSKLKAVLERITHTNFQIHDRSLPRFCKVGGSLIQGGSRFGGQEFAIQYLIDCLVIQNCIPVSGDTPESYIGAPGRTFKHDKKSIMEDTEALKTARNLGQRVAEISLIIKRGIDQNKNILPKEYFYNQ